ncbi:MAG: hypothetical protein ABI068_14710 [Ktedonobacterales bacterium]
MSDPILLALTPAPFASLPLYERLCSFENLLCAFRQAARGKRRRPDVTLYDYNLEGYLLNLRDHTCHPQRARGRNPTEGGPYNS